MAEVGRRRVGRAFAPTRVALYCHAARGDAHVAVFQGPARFGAARDTIVFRSDQLGFASHPCRDGLTTLLQAPWPEGAGGVADTVKWVLVRLLSGCRPDFGQVVHELGFATCTLRRRTTDEGQTFRGLLTATRQGLAHVHLAQPCLGLDEVAFLLGVDTGNSSLGALRRREGKTPRAWRGPGRAAFNNAESGSHVVSGRCDGARRRAEPRVGKRSGVGR